MMGMNRLTLVWILSGLSLVGASGALAVNSHKFGYQSALIDMPIIFLVAGYAAAGLIFLATAVLACKTHTGSPSLLFWVLIAGLLMRLFQFAAEPVLEDDYQRYLWDGAITAEGGNPYKYSPLEFLEWETAEQPYKKLAAQAEETLNRINYPQYRTIYPPVAQGAFALAYKLGAFSLTAWRAVLLAIDIAIAGLVIFLLKAAGRPLIMCTLYWWNPLVVKEVFNSAHMDPVVIVFVLTAMALLVSRKFALSAIALAFGAGAKLWPVILLPLILRASGENWRRQAVLTLVFASASALLLLPVLMSTLDTSSGFIAYAQKWQTNSAGFLILDGLASFWPFSAPSPGMLTRGIAGLALAAIVVYLLRRAPRTPEEILRIGFLCITSLFLLSPSQFPWYFLWVAPLLPLFPLRGLLIAAALLPLYYAYFYLAPRDMAKVHTYGVVWLLWVPVWIALTVEWYQLRPSNREEI